MDAAKDLSIGFYAMADDPAVAVRANRRKRMDRALEAIEGVVCAANDYLERLVIFIFTNFACSHTKYLSHAVALAAVSDLFSQAKIILIFRSGPASPMPATARIPAPVLTWRVLAGICKGSCQLPLRLGKWR